MPDDRGGGMEVTPSTIHSTASGRPSGSHPAWCTKQSPGCNGTSHHSHDIAVPEDQCAGEGVQVALWGESRLYIALMFTPVRDTADVLTLAHRAAAGEVDEGGRHRRRRPSPDVVPASR
jgi:hypothetical protein